VRIIMEDKMIGIGSEQYPSLVSSLKATFKNGITRPIEFRKVQLNNMLRMLDDHENDFVQALKQDLNKSRMEAVCMEVEFCRNSIRGAIADIDSWAVDEHVEKNLVTLLDTTFIRREPLGLVLVMGAWNYPLQLTILPAIGAIAAGNCVVIKTSEVAPATANILEKIFPQFMDDRCYKVLQGGIPETTELLKMKFDHIFYTGGGNVGRIIARAASANLTPCTLELGGKSPIYIDTTVNLELAAKRLIWGKCMNVGQTCVAPDYVLCSQETQDKLVPILSRVYKEFYGESAKQSPDMCRIINDRHYERLSALLDKTKGKIVIGQERDPEQKFLDLHVITDVTENDAVMLDEIFGPILPMVTAESVEDAIAFINSKDKPLSLYIFSENKQTREKILSNTSSGSICVNDVCVQLSVETLPFGGVGASGYGAYHGKYSFDIFSHKKSVLIRDFSFVGENLGKFRYPPYSDRKLHTSKMMLKKRNFPTFPLQAFWYVVCMGIGAVLMYFGQDIAAKIQNDANFTDRT